MACERSTVQAAGAPREARGRNSLGLPVFEPGDNNPVVYSRWIGSGNPYRTPAAAAPRPGDRAVLVAWLGDHAFDRWRPSSPDRGNRTDCPNRQGTVRGVLSEAMLSAERLPATLADGQSRAKRPFGRFLRKSSGRAMLDGASALAASPLPVTRPSGATGKAAQTAHGHCCRSTPQ